MKLYVVVAIPAFTTEVEVDGNTSEAREYAKQVALERAHDKLNDGELCDPRKFQATVMGPKREE